MAIVVIGGNSRNVGKTSVVAGLIAALPDCNWTAMKISQHGHGISTHDGDSCDRASDGRTWSITEENDRSGESDTSRFLVGGAARVWWVRCEQGRLEDAMPAIRRMLAESQNVIVESNSILKFIRPDVYITVLDPSTKDVKASAQGFLHRADAVILHEHGRSGKVDWEGISLKPVAECPVFRIKPPPYVTPEIIAFVKAKVAQSVLT